MLKKSIFIILPIFLIGSHLTQRIRNWYRVQKEVREIQANIDRLQEERKNLEYKKNYYQTDEFVRREAREKLGLTREDELVLVLPELPDLPEENKKGRKITPDSPAWKQWWDLFFAVN